MCMCNLQVSSFAREMEELARVADSEVKQQSRYDLLLISLSCTFNICGSIPYLVVSVLDSLSLQR